jgi:signal transduction histidine kinase
MDPIYNIPLFHDATDDEIQWLIDNSQERFLAPGDYFTHEREPTRHFYIVLEGELQVLLTVNGQETVVGTTPRGVMGGEVWLLTGARGGATTCAIVPTRLMVFDYAHFLQIFSHVPPLGAQIVRTAAERLQGFASNLKQQEKLAALGKFSAGLAHELNNPASAARRAAITLRTTLPTLSRQALKLSMCGLGPDQVQQMINFQEAVTERALSIRPLSTLEQSDREEAMLDWLQAHGVKNGEELAATFVTTQVDPAELARIFAIAPDADALDLLMWLHEGLCAAGLLDELEQTTRRIADLVVAIKSYTYMDQGGLQEVNIHRDLEMTLRMLKHKIGEIQVERRFDPDLPLILGRGGDLNQVWTNLIDNAIDALEGRGVITLITRCENNYVMVEVADNGPGIPPAIQHRIFEPFFTTKSVGAGTGMGLDTSYRIVHQHNGTIEVQSQPEHTRFIVRLPIGAGT